MPLVLLFIRRRRKARTSIVGREAEAVADQFTLSQNQAPPRP
jgi:hypothetical protein